MHVCTVCFMMAPKGGKHPPGCHLETLVPLGMFTQKLVPKWIIWNRFTEIGLDNSLMFTLVI